MGKLNTGQSADQGTLCSCPPWSLGERWCPSPSVLCSSAPTAFLLPDRFLTRLLKEREGSDELGFRPIQARAYKCHGWLHGPGQEKTEGVRSGLDIRRCAGCLCGCIPLPLPRIINIQLWNSFKTRPTFSSPLPSSQYALWRCAGHANKSTFNMTWNWNF